MTPATPPVEPFDPTGGAPAWIYRGTLRHRRYVPVERTFTYSLFEVLLDVDRLDEAFSRAWTWSRERANLATFRRSDYLAPHDLPIRDAVRARVAELGGGEVDGPVWMLTHLRYFGYCFNPVTFYYCYRTDGRLRAVLGEITNTPWKERHSYLVRAGDDVRGAGAYDERGRTLRRVFGKAFHVSPFFGMEHEYDWRFTPPGGDLLVHMENREPDDDGGRRLVFDATLRLERRVWSRKERLRTLLSFPAMTAKVWLGIHWQALRLWLAGVPVQPHPKNGVEANGPP